MYSELGLFIDGAWLDGVGRKGEEVLNPATGKALAALPHASSADLDAALAAAEKGLRSGAIRLPMSVARSCARRPT